MAAKITWKLIQVKAGDLKPNPHNPKKRDQAGYNRLKKATKKFGLVFSGICNKDLSIIDGHSRKELANTDEPVSVFIPSRQLTEAEYKEMNAVYDIARAGDVDMQIIEEQFTEEFMNEWEIEKNKTVSFQVKPKAAKPKFPILIECKDEKHRKSLLNRFQKQGLSAKII